MLPDLTRDGWLRILNLPAERVPQAVPSRGTRNLKAKDDKHRALLGDVLDLGSHDTPVYIASAMFAASPADLDRWHALGCGDVGLETAATHAVTKHLDMQSVGLWFIFDNPRGVPT